MKIAHIVMITPAACGLYETTRDLVVALRRAGMDSRMVHPKGDIRLTEDRGAPVASFTWAAGADLIVNHSGYDGTPIEDLTTPVIHVCHGRPRHSFNSELAGKTPIVSYLYRHNKDPRWKAAVTFWPEHVPYLQAFMPDKPVCHVPAPVDLDWWSPGERDFGFGGKGAEINVVCTDAWRDDVDPFEAVMGFLWWHRRMRHPEARLHLYGSNDWRKPGWAALVKLLQDADALGQVAGRVTQDRLRDIYRSADMLLTPNRIATRAVREATACGLQVVRTDPDLEVTAGRLTSASRFGGEVLSRTVRASDARAMSPEGTARAFLQVVERYTWLSVTDTDPVLLSMLPSASQQRQMNEFASRMAAGVSVTAADGCFDIACDA